MWCEHVRGNDAIVQQLLLTRGPHGSHLFASLQWHADSGCSLEAIDRTMCYITQEGSSQGHTVSIRSGTAPISCDKTLTLLYKLFDAGALPAATSSVKRPYFNGFRMEKLGTRLADLPPDNLIELYRSEGTISCIIVTAGAPSRKGKPIVRWGRKAVGQAGHWPDS